MNADEKIYQCFLELIPLENLLKKVEKLWQVEQGQTFQAYKKAADFTFRMMKEAGLKRVEKISFPADGKTAYQDKISPLAWQASCGKLEIISSPLAFADPVVADYKRHPFHLIKGSTATPPEGIYVRLVSEQQAFSGQDLKNCLVVLEPDSRPVAPLTEKLLDLGACGWVNTYVTDRYLTPDGIGWVNACTEGAHWHVHQQDRPFIGFSVSPRTGDRLRQAIKCGNVLAKATCDGKRFCGEIDLVTGILPGQDSRELYLLAHLYEPLPDDNATGVVAAICLAQCLQKLVEKGKLKPLRFTLRLVFGLEVYGFAAFAERKGGYLDNKTVGALNLDGFPCHSDCGVNIHLAPYSVPFCGNVLMEEMVSNLPAKCLPLVHPVLKKTGTYADDMLLNDATVALRTIWVLTEHRLHHNSFQTMEIIHPETYRQYLAFQGTWIARMLNLEEKCAQDLIRRQSERTIKEIKKMVSCKSTDYLRWLVKRQRETWKDFQRLLPQIQVENHLDKFSEKAEKIISRRTDAGAGEKDSAEKSRLLVQASSIIPARATRGFPFSLALIPEEERKLLPQHIIYGPLASILSWMDGCRSLAQLIKTAQWETEKNFTEKEIRSYLSAVEYLTTYGYLKTEYLKSISRKDIVRALQDCGIRKGDLLLIHSSLSVFGHIDKGAETVIDAFLEAVGSTGTVLFPTFTYPYLYFNGEVVTGTRYQPFQQKNTAVWTGTIPATVLKRKEVIRSVHPTHSVAGIGPLAKACLCQHRETDPPAGSTSPFAKLLDYNGKMVWFGADLASTTFFHFLETEAHLPYLQPAVCRILRENGFTETVLIPQHLPGHRDFYKIPGEKSKAYQQLLQAGLVIRKTNLGYGEIKVIRAKQMYRLGREVLKQDPGVFLCDDNCCLFCRQYQHLKK